MELIAIIFLLFGFYNGMRNGFIPEVLSIFNLIVSLFIASRFSSFLDPYTNNPIISSVVLFAISYILIGFIIDRFMFFRIGTTLDRLLGGIVGLVEMAFFIGIITFLMKDFTLVQAFREKSEIVKYIEKHTHPIVKKVIGKHEGDNP